MSSKRKRKDLCDLSNRSFRRRVVQEINKETYVSPTAHNSNELVNEQNVPISSDNNNSTLNSCSFSSSLQRFSINLNNDSEDGNKTNIFDSENENSDSLSYESVTTSNSNYLNESLDDQTLVINNESQFKDELIFWAVMNKIKHNALDDLLSILRKQTCGQNLPMAARTLLSTPRNTMIRPMSPGYYCHFGIRAGLLEVFASEPIKFKDFKINLKISTDGLPLSQSSTSELWPIMGCILNSSHVFLVGVYHGHSKPENANEFLREFVDEVIDLINNGFLYEQALYTISIYCITCDTPARSFITMTKGHAGYFSCSKCCQEGEYVDHRMCFPIVSNNVLRTDNSFINQEYEDYQLGRCILIDIPNFKPVSLIPLDYMHLTCIGVMRKIMCLWLSGKPASKIVRLPTNKIKLISSNLIAIKIYIPNNFARRPQKIEKLGSWKATELRQFLLYTAPVILYGILNPQVYSHVITLHVAMRILSNKDLLEQFADYAQSLLEHFVDTFSKLYGKRFISHNVHGLLHIVNDAKLLGPIHDFSTFQFENFLRVLKMQLRKSDKPLQQIHRRYKEKANLNSCIHLNKKREMPYKKNHWDGPILITSDVNQQYKDAKIKNCVLSTESPNNICIINQHEIVIIKNFVYDRSKKCMVILGNIFTNKKEIYETPCKSSLIGCYLASNITQNIKSWPVTDIIYKCMALPWNHDDSNSLAVFPLLHSDSLMDNEN